MKELVSFFISNGVHMNDVTARRICLLCRVDTKDDRYVPRQLPAILSWKKRKMRSLDFEIVTTRTQTLLIVQPERCTAVMLTYQLNFVRREGVRTQ